MEKTIAGVFAEPMSSQCDSVAWYGIGLDDDFLFDLVKKFVKEGTHKDLIQGLVEDTNSESVQDMLENGFIDSESGRNLAEGLASKYHLNSDIYFTASDENYYMIGVPLHIADGIGDLNEINAKLPNIEKLSDEVGVEYGFYHGIAWTDF